MTYGISWASGLSVWTLLWDRQAGTKYFATRRKKQSLFWLFLVWQGQLSALHPAFLSLLFFNRIGGDRKEYLCIEIGRERAAMSYHHGYTVTTWEMLKYFTAYYGVRWQETKAKLKHLPPIFPFSPRSSSLLHFQLLYLLLLLWHRKNRL